MRSWHAALLLISLILAAGCSDPFGGDDGQGGEASLAITMTRTGEYWTAEATNTGVVENRYYDMHVLFPGSTTQVTVGDWPLGMLGRGETQTVMGTLPPGATNCTVERVVMVDGNRLRNVRFTVTYR
ncbi:MAG: hypothetical protein GYA23_06610 [Methanomicrobiales archaeon]|nr:hypothetical protein [Methanomicrobiales archaeon]